eukprot:m.289057 g.289057  ORF g.289057 m.289057 type:complete len:80 (+) comp19455_c2_seq16:2637-2876(+)
MHDVQPPTCLPHSRAPACRCLLCPFQLHLRLQSNGLSNDHLMTSHTCFRTIEMPVYPDVETMRARLLTAVQNSQGFALL